MDAKESIFKKLSDIDISTMVKTKGKFWYMPWANAVREVVKNYPSMNWEFTDYDGLPFLETKIGFFVECSVAIDGLTRKQMMPVLDFKNQTNMSPLAADINKAQMRALAKCIALHGLGLDLWAGEDQLGWGDDEGLTESVTQAQVNESFKEVSDWLATKISSLASVPNDAAVRTVGNNIKEHLRAQCENKHFDKRSLIETLNKAVAERLAELK